MGTAINTISNIDIADLYYKIKATEKQISEQTRELHSAKERLAKANTNASDIHTLDYEYKKTKGELDNFEQIRRNIQSKISQYNSLRSEWSRKAEDACKKAALLGLEVTFSASGIAVYNNPIHSGIYSDFSSQGSQQPIIKTSTFKFKGAIANDFKERILKVYPTWLEMAKAFWEVWKETDKLFKPNYDTTFADVLHALNSEISKGSDKLKDIDYKLQGLNRNNFGNPSEEIKAYEGKINALSVNLERLREQYDNIYETDPILGILYKGNSAYNEQWLERIEKLAQTRTALRGLKIPGGVLDLRTQKNIFISSRNSNKNKADYFKALLATYLLAFKPGVINIDIIEKDPSPQLVHGLDRSICKITDYKNHIAISEVINRLKQRYIELEYNPNGEIPSQLTIFYGYDDKSFDSIVKELNDVIAYGPARGLYFILVGGEGFDMSQSEHLRNKFNPVEFQAPDNLLSRDTDVRSSGKKLSLESWIFDHFQSFAKYNSNKVCPSLVDGTFYDRRNRLTEITAAGKNEKPKMIVPFAEKSDGTELNIVFTSDSASSTFVVGQTGVGKSYLLHSILSNMMLKYDTTAVELILMDFKTAGVELNYYKDVPHVSHLLVNGNDKQMVQEILKSIEKEMRQRGDALTTYDCEELAGYNKIAKSKGLKTYPYMIMVVDECSGLFEADQGIGIGTDEIKRIITKIAKEGRNQGIFMILSTQTYHGSGIPRDVIKQFKTFMFMKCSAEDVADCDINDSDLKNRVGSLKKSEVIMFRDNQKTEGRVYDYAGKKESDDDAMGIYKKKTIRYLRDPKNYTNPTKKQFYFSSKDRKYFENNEFDALAECIKNGKICMLPGRRISTDQKPVVCELKQAQGNNVLILGVNSERQAERVMWAGVMSLWKTSMNRDRDSQFYIFDNTSDGKPIDQLPIVNEISRLRNVSILPDSLKLLGIGDVFADVLLRNAELEKEKAANNAEIEGSSLADLVKLHRSKKTGNKKFPPIFLILPNHETFFSQLNKEFKIPKKITEYSENQEQTGSTTKGTNGNVKETDFGSIIMGGENATSTMPKKIENFSEIGKTADSIKTYAEALNYILSYGSEVGVHVIIQTSDLSKVIPNKKFSSAGNELNQLFSEIIMLRMPIAAAESITLGCHRLVAELPAELDRLRALIYSPYAISDNLSYLIPFDFPKEKDIDGLFRKLQD